MEQDHDDIVAEDPLVPDAHPELLEEEPLDEPEMPAHEAPEPEDEHEEAPIRALNRFLAIRIVYGDGLRRMPSTSAN